MSLHCNCGDYQGFDIWSVDRSVDIYCVQETRYRGKSIRMIGGKQQSILDKNWKRFRRSRNFFDQDHSISSVSHRIIIVKVLAQGIVISVISVYAPQCGVDDRQKDDFYNSFIVVIAGKSESRALTFQIFFNFLQ